MASITSAEKVRALHAWPDVTRLPADAPHLELGRRCLFQVICGSRRAAPLYAKGDPLLSLPQRGRVLVALQAPMSAVEDIKKYGSLNERYGAMEDRLKVTRASVAICCAGL